ncbi:MAG: metalloregulator ArsR/SmtB family transcription factor [Planctomycetes bacterium]|nr:metalloregulator ArsR/SmtB family transcription factor [Planctomycetota bacterium]
MTAAQLKAQAEWVFAFGEPTRLKIVRALATGVKTVTELAKAAKTEIVNVSHHLSVMKAAGVVKCDRDGRFMRYSLLGTKATAVAIEMTHESGAKVTLPLN